MPYKIISIESIREFSFKEKRNFDLSMTVKVRSGWWPFVNRFEVTVFRHNPTHEIAGKLFRRFDANFVKCEFYYPNGGKIEKGFNEALHKHHSNMEKIKRELDQKEAFRKEIGEACTKNIVWNERNSPNALYQGGKPEGERPPKK